MDPLLSAPPVTLVITPLAIVTSITGFTGLTVRSPTTPPSGFTPPPSGSRNPDEPAPLPSEPDPAFPFPVPLLAPPPSTLLVPFFELQPKTAHDSAIKQAAPRNRDFRQKLAKLWA